MVFSMKQHEYLTKLLKSLREKTSLATIDNKELLQKIKNKNLILYFYPKDNTTGCTQEGKDFTKLYNDFQSHNTEIIGISKDDVSSHASFKNKQCFSFELISDFDGVICQAFDVNKLNSTSIMRSTFLFNKQGLLVQDWKNVKVLGHAEKVLLRVQNIDS
jgi:peroxiredoxin Q/BCP